MQHKYKYLLAGFGILAFGLAAGYAAGISKEKPLAVCEAKQEAPREGMHIMPDGTMMGNEKMDMAGMMDDMMAGLAGKTGDEFDQAFIEEMIVHHEGAVAMAEAALASAKHDEIKKLATAIIAAQTKEISQMKAWLASWYPPEME